MRQVFTLEAVGSIPITSIPLKTSDSYRRSAVPLQSYTVCKAAWYAGAVYNNQVCEVLARIRSINSDAPAL